MASVDAVGQLGQMDFLNLLATQLRNQNPMNPVDNTQFLSQLAQFSALQASTKTADAVTQLSQQNTKVLATNLLGKQVSGTGSDNVGFSGQVTGLDFSGTTPKVYIGSKIVLLSNITRIS